MMKLFIDIETATLYKPEEFETKNKALYDIWVERVAKEEEPVGFYWSKWPIYAEYSQVTCVSIWVETDEGLRVHSVYQAEGVTEYDLLFKLKELLDHQKFVWAKMVGHNILWFDIPFLVKRYIVNGLTLPKLLRVWTMKPWEVNVDDTLKMWKSTGVMGAWLELIARLLWISDVKSIMNGSEASSYFHEWKYEDIKNYCEEDVRVVHQTYNKMVELWVNG